MNPLLPHLPSNTIALQCITRTTVVTETPSLDVSQSNGKENMTPTGKQLCSSQKKPSEEQLRMQFQSSSGPPKKRLSPKRSSTSTGGNFDENLQPIKKSKSTDSSDDTEVAVSSNQSKKARPSQSFETGPRGKKLDVTRKALENANAQIRRHDLVNAALYPSHPHDSYYRQSEDGTSHRNHIGLKVQFVDDVPRTHSVERAEPRKRLYSYRLGHISPTQPPANWDKLVSLAPRYASRSTVHSQSTPYTPTRRPLLFPTSKYYHHATPEVLNDLMRGPLIRTPKSFYYRLYGHHSSSSQVPSHTATKPSLAGNHSSSSQVPIHSATKPSARSAGHHSSSSQAPIHSATKSSTRLASQDVSFAQPATVASTSAPGKSATKAQTRYNTRNSATPKKTSRTAIAAHKIIYQPSLTTKPCKCTKSQCLKLYCECFDGGRICRENFCKCKGCKNHKEHDPKDSDRAVAIREILKRKPRAFKKPQSRK